jgi:hypothetical protein
MRTFSIIPRVLTMLCVLLGGAICAGTPAAGTRVAIPSAAAQIEARKLVHAVYGDSIAKAKEPDEKVLLVKRMLENVEETQGDPARQYVLLALAGDLAVEAADVALALSVVDQTGRRFAIDDPATRLEVLNKFMARPPVPDGVAVMITDIKEQQDELAKLKEPLAVLAKNPGNAAANLAVGNEGRVDVLWKIGGAHLVLELDGSPRKIKGVNKTGIPGETVTGVKAGE